MAKILAVIANPRENSHTSQLMQSFLHSYKRHNPTDTITELDLYKTAIPVIDGKVLEAWDKKEGQHTVEETAILDRIDQFTQQFITADKVVIAAPMWNLQFPPMLLSYISTIAVAGKTFKYTEGGCEGLVPDKPVLLLHVRGGFYSEGQAQALDHAVPYLKSIFNLLGISNFKTILCEGIEAVPDQSQKIFEQALRATVQLAEIF